ncbi:MAG TPA: glutamate--cysteine ligase [Burkholderiales bacterium]|nr:glutamate--cysteine ligase [Burkholderiales bacterium]
MSLEERLGALTPEILCGIRRGLEKESLRVGSDGRLSAAPHPAALGAALTHPHITTDFSEAQLELITGVHTSVQDCLDELQRIHQVVVRAIGDELLWCASMPCRLPAEHDIPLGRYGRSNVGTAKTVYRRGLSYRYGRRMQTISGIHYNFSLPETAWPALQAVDACGGSVEAYRNDAYFALIRNFRRHAWLPLYLIGASPAVCASFVAGRRHALQTLARGTLYLPYGTTLRMGPLGYQSAAQATLAVSYNDLRSYARSLHGALTEPYPPYEKIGIKAGEEYRQLSAALLQIENEFYGTIRPKQPIQTGERPLHALGERGVAYVEARLVDLDPDTPLGIRAQTMRLLETFLLWCVLADSPPDTPAETAELAHNQHTTAERGRAPDVRLLRRGEERRLAEWGGEVLRGCEPIAAALDAAHGTDSYRAALAEAQAMLDGPARTPSARVLAELEAFSGKSYPDFVLARSRSHRAALLALPLDPAVEAQFAKMAADSIAEQASIEAADQQDFESFRQHYLSQELMGGAFVRP